MRTLFETFPMSIHTFGKKRTFSALLAVSFILFSWLHSVEIRLNPPSKFYVQDGKVFLNLETEKSLLSKEVLQNLEDSIPITITYFIDLHEKGSWFDTKVFEKKINKLLFRDIWSDAYFVKSEKENIKINTIDKLENHLVYLSSIPYIDVESLDPNKKYYFKTRIAVKIRTYSSFYQLINNILSLLHYRTSYKESPSYLGKILINSKTTTNEIQ